VPHSTARVFNRAELERVISERNERFEALTPAERRVSIAIDVREQLRMKRLIAAEGTYLSPAEDTTYDVRWTGAQDSVDRLPQCHVCAIGAIFVAAGQLFDRMPSGSLDAAIGFAKYGYLRNFFSSEQLQLIEAAFECNLMFAEDAGAKQAADAMMFGESFDDETERMDAIFTNIMANGGTFIPKRGARYKLDVELTQEDDI
jgi:hypothetical protein